MLVCEVKVPGIPSMEVHLRHLPECIHFLQMRPCVPLTQCGANVDAVDYNQQTALMIAIFSGARVQVPVLGGVRSPERG